MSGKASAIPRAARMLLLVLALAASLLASALPAMAGGGKAPPGGSVPGYVQPLNITWE